MATQIGNLIFRTDSKAISCNRQFCISPVESTESYEKILFRSPSHKIIAREIPSPGGFVHFLISNEDLNTLENAHLEIHHIAEYIQRISATNFSYGGCRIYVYITGSSALFVVKRIMDYLFAQVFHFETQIDLLYYTQACFQDLKLDRTTDQLILCGEIASDSKIVRMISIYFPNVVTDSSMPLATIAG